MIAPAPKPSATCEPSACPACHGAIVSAGEFAHQIGCPMDPTLIPATTLTDVEARTRALQLVGPSYPYAFAFDWVARRYGLDVAGTMHDAVIERLGHDIQAGTLKGGRRTIALAELREAGL